MVYLVIFALMSTFSLNCMQQYRVVIAEQPHVPGLVIPEETPHTSAPSTFEPAGPRKHKEKRSSSSSPSPEIKALAEAEEVELQQAKKLSAIKSKSSAGQVSQKLIRTASFAKYLVDAEELDKQNFKNLGKDTQIPLDRNRIAQQIHLVRTAQHGTMAETEKINLYKRSKSARVLDVTPPITPHLSPKTPPTDCSFCTIL